MSFRDAVAQTQHLGAGAAQAGLQALDAPDRVRIACAKPRRLRGSVNVDRSLQPHRPNDNRWDYAICYERDAEEIFWVEVHPASDGDVAVVQRKFEWLRAWLSADGRPLDGFPRQFIWVSSGKTTFTQGSPAIRKLALKGLRAVGRTLSLD